MIITTKQMKVDFTNEEKEIIRKFHKLIDEINTTMFKEKIETVEINDNEYTDKEISEVEEIIWNMF